MERIERVEDLETDMIIGKGIEGAILNLVVRKERFFCMGLVEKQTKKSFSGTSIELFEDSPVHTNNLSNGKKYTGIVEFSEA